MRKYTIAFGNLFNDIRVERRNTDGSVAKTLKVPLAYGPKEKFLIREEQDPDLDRQIAVSLPRMSFERTGLFYDGSRKLNNLSRDVFVDSENSNGVKLQFTPVPYSFSYTLSAMTHYLEDGDQIAEQIIPYFVPDFTISMILTDSGIKRDVPIVLDSVSLDDAYEGGFEERRIAVWTFNFIMKGFLFGPIDKSNIITESIVNTHVPLFAEEPISRTTSRPGLTADGNPTSNSSLTIPRNQISANSNFGYIENTVDL